MEEEQQEEEDDDALDSLTPSTAPQVSLPDVAPPPVAVAYDSDSGESVLSSASELATTKQRRKNVNFSNEQEQDLAEWLQQHPYLYNLAEPNYRNKPLKDRLKAEKAASMDPPTTAKDLEAWLRGMRTRFGKLTRTKSGDGAPKKMTERDQWIVQLFGFMGSAITRTSETRTLGPKQV